VCKLDEAGAREYGHTYGPGASYITDYVATVKNTNQTSREAAMAFLAARSEG
jgi:hypothetical protein